MSDSTRAIGRALVVLLAVVIVIVVGLGLMIGGNNGDDTKSAAETSETTSSVPTDDPTDETCPARFVQRDISDKKLARFIKGGIDAKTAKKSTNKLLAAVGHDASTLRFYAVQFGIKNLPTEAKMLNADGTCLSEAGRQVHHDLTVVMNASGQKFGQAPSGAWNTGVDQNGNPVVDSQPGIRGNRKAVVYTLPDGTKVIILVRCGNPALPEKPDLPEGDTDNPPPPKCKHNCNPPPKCPSGQVGTPPDCLTPKSDDPDDYVYPDGKPPVDNPGPADDNPPDVDTDQDGGGGVNDNPTNPPGSETGGNAPGADPPRDNPPTQPPEGGDGNGNEDNDGTVEEP